MTRTLDVYLHTDHVGRLIQNDRGLMLFEYTTSWVEREDAVRLSYSLPLEKRRFVTKECRGFFAGILPEQDKREQIAKILGISARNDFALLEQLGGECAGAVTLLPEGVPLSETDTPYRWLSERDLAEILRELPRRPLMAGEAGVRLSLAGAQDKIAVYRHAGEIALPLENSPSTHIIKPAIAHFAGLVYNEAFCMQLARIVGLPTAEIEIAKAGGIDYLCIARYDRTRDAGGNLMRRHQEDFCQALGVVPERKYQGEGGPSLKQCFHLLREASAVPVLDLQGLLDAVIFNYLIGNNDAHGKNFSLLYEARNARLSPLYDLVSTIFYPELTPKMAMKIGEEAQFEKVTGRDFEKLAAEAGLSKPGAKQRVRELADRVRSETAQIKAANPVAAELKKIIQRRCDAALRRM